MTSAEVFARRESPTVEPEVIEDLRARLRATRWPDAPDGAHWSLGADVDYLRGLIDYWADGFNWNTFQESMVSLPYYRAQVAGLDINVVHARSAGTASAIPLLLTHGWPDSHWRYLKVISLLADPGAHGADPADAFDVIVPDMPGFGFSQIPEGAALNARQVAGMWAELMTGLGYETFATAGGDIGSAVGRYLALDHPERVTAVHRMDVGVSRFPGDPQTLTAEERAWMAEAVAWSAAEGAYGAMHRTKPQTAAVGLTDSPAGLAAWIVEKLRSWSDCGGDLESVFTKDEILTLISQYWVRGTIGSSMRMYHANFAIPDEQLMRRVETPSGFTLFPGDLLKAPRAWLERTANTIYLSHPPRGGHFAPFEQPELYAAELRELFRPFRKVGSRLTVQT